MCSLDVQGTFWVELDRPHPLSAEKRGRPSYFFAQKALNGWFVQFLSVFEHFEPKVTKIYLFRLLSSIIIYPWSEKSTAKKRSKTHCVIDP
jgi:hypothetical protein